MDILACLVERSVAFDKELAQSSRVETIQEADESVHQEHGGESSSFVSEKAELTEEDHASTFASIGAPTVESRDMLQSPPKNLRRSAINLPPSDSFSPDLTDAVSMLRRISQDFERTMAVEGEAMNHSMRMKAIEELLRSHTYAVEMRQAAKSASTWLRSIDRSDGTSDKRGHQMGEPEDVDKSSADISSELYISEANEEKNPNRSAGNEHRSEVLISKGEIDMVVLKSMLHAAELKAKEKEDLALRLDAELSKCRAEIGRLKTASRAEVSSLQEPKMMWGGLIELKCVSCFVFITNRLSWPLPIDPYWMMMTTSRRPRLLRLLQTTLVLTCSMISSTTPVRFLGHTMN